jgi:cytochrome c
LKQCSKTQEADLMRETTKVGAFLALALGAVMSLPAVAADGDAANGEKLFRKCKVCHVADEEKNRLGPHFIGLFGRKAGSVEGFKYSEAMASSDIVWDAQTLDAYLADPKGYVPKNKMAFVGLKDEQDRADIVAYLEQVTAE